MGDRDKSKEKGADGGVLLIPKQVQQLQTPFTPFRYIRRLHSPWQKAAGSPKSGQGIQWGTMGCSSLRDVTEE